LHNHSVDDANREKDFLKLELLASSYKQTQHLRRISFLTNYEFESVWGRALADAVNSTKIKFNANDFQRHII